MIKRILISSILAVGLLLYCVSPVLAEGEEPPDDELYFSNVDLRRDRVGDEEFGVRIKIVNPTGGQLETDVTCTYHDALGVLDDVVVEDNNITIAASSYQYADLMFDPSEDPDQHIWWWFIVESDDVTLDIVGYINCELGTNTKDHVWKSTFDLFCDVGDTLDVTNFCTGTEAQSYWLRWWDCATSEYGTTTAGFEVHDLQPTVIGSFELNLSDYNWSDDLESYPSWGVWLNTYGTVNMECTDIWCSHISQTVGEDVELWAEIENTGSANGTVQFTPYITEPSLPDTPFSWYSKNVTLDAGESEWVQFDDYTIEETGTHIYTVGEKQTNFMGTYLQPVPNTTVPDPDPDPPVVDTSGLDDLTDDWTDMAAGIGCIVLIGGVGGYAYFSYRKKWIAISAGILMFIASVVVGWCPPWLAVTGGIIIAFYTVYKTLIKRSGLSNNNAVITIALVNIVISQIGVFAGYTVDGELVAHEISKTGWNLVDWILGTIDYMWHFATFQIDDMPIFLSCAFILMNVLGLYLLIKLARGVS